MSDGEPEIQDELNDNNDLLGDTGTSNDFTGPGTHTYQKHCQIIW